MKLLIWCRNYRGLPSVGFQPSGVCALVGANGSGKSTLLSAFEFLRNLFLRSTQSAISLDGGHWGLRNLNSNPDAPVWIGVNLDGKEWRIELSLLGTNGECFLHEGIWSGNENLIDVTSNIEHFRYRDSELTRGDGSALRLVWDLFHDPAIEDIVNFVRSIRTYRHYHLSQLREHGSRVDSDLYLLRHGQNLFAVLRNWRDRRDLRPSYDFVIESLRAAFPNFFDDLDFYGDAQTVRAKVYLQGVPEPMPLTFVPDGLLVSMLHLVAVAGSPGKSFVAIDDFENYLHPFAIRSLIESIRAWGERRDLCVLLVTHSPVVLDEFRSQPEQVFVMDLDPPNKPIPLDVLRDPEWLAHFSLGNLYSHLEFGSRLPSVQTTTTVTTPTLGTAP